MNNKEIIATFEKDNRKCFGKYNKAFVIGKIIEEFEEAEIEDGKVYNTKVRTQRSSGLINIVQITIPEELKKSEDYLEKEVIITGEYRSSLENGHKRMFLYARTLEIYTDSVLPEETNLVYLEGFLTKKPFTKNEDVPKRKLASFCIAVRRKDSTNPEDADYINCIAWNKNQDVIKNYTQGKLVKLYGLMHSRKGELAPIYSVKVFEFA